MSNEKIKIGDTVILNSGGPLMTVDNIGEYAGKTKARCVWFSNDESKVDVFPLETLSKEE